MKKTSQRRFLLYFLPYLFFILILCFPARLRAEDSDEAFLFKKIAVLNIEDRTGESYGEKVEKTVRAELEQMLRFEIIPPEKSRIRYPVSPESLSRMSKKLQADGFVAGYVVLSGKNFNISLEILDRSGATFALELMAVKKQASPADFEKSIRELTVRLVHRIPYKAVVTRVENDTVTLDAGRIHGAGPGMKLSLFEIAGVKRHPFTNEVISFNREDLGQILITRAEALSAVGKVINLKKGAKIEVGQKVDFIPSEKIIQSSLAEKKKLLAEQQPAEQPETQKARATRQSKKGSRGSLIVGTGFLLNDYKFSSDNLNFKRHTSPVPMVTATGEYWILTPLGVDVSYARSWMRFDQTSSTPETDATASWYSAHLKYRYFFSSDASGPEVAGAVGYRVYDFKVDPSDSNFFNNIKYSGVDIALTAVYPITPKIRGALNFGFQPSLDVKEDPVTSGTGSTAYAYTIGLTGYYKITSRMSLAAGYSYQDYETKFSGTGTRGPGPTNAKSSDRYQLFNLSLVYEF